MVYEWALVGWNVVACKQSSIDIHWFEASVMSAWHPDIDQRSSIHSSMLLCGVKTGPLRTDLWRLLLVEHRCLRSTGRMWWGSFVSNSEISHKVLDPRVQSWEQPLIQYRLRRLRLVLHMSAERLLRCTLFNEAGSGCRMERSGQLTIR